MRVHGGQPFSVLSLEVRHMHGVHDHACANHAGPTTLPSLSSVQLEQRYDIAKVTGAKPVVTTILDRVVLKHRRLRCIKRYGPLS